MKRIQEFWYCVASQEELPLYKGHEISSSVCDNLLAFIEHYKEEVSKGKNLKTFLSEALIKKPSIINHLRLLLGISDKRLYLDLTFIFNRATTDNGERLLNESRENLVKHDTKFFINQLTNSDKKEHFSRLITDYFINRGIEDIIHIFSRMDKNQITSIFNNLIAPKEIQQKQAKYRGHGAEMAFAKIFHDCGVTIVPENKHINPMAGYDPNVDLTNMTIVPRNAANRNIHSFDLVVKDNEGNIRVLVQSLIHSSDPGQYGVNKSDETLEIKKLINNYNSRNSQKPVYLLGSVDGVGFCENPNGTIVKMIDVFDDFFQINTLFKIPIFLQKIGLIDNVKGIKFDTDFFDEHVIEYFEKTYLKPANIQNLTNSNCNFTNYIKAGKGTVIFK
uniref:BsrGI restriction endonuclease n=1 Tax=Geobacillus stearothermophilus TaxID=1422 RepID=Q1PGP7_GEOSE|nr:BsrGI restriction endonuclease [Geobacillus stearothermophilus]